MTTPIATADCDGSVTLDTAGVPVWGNGPVSTAVYTLNGQPIALPYTYKPGESITSTVFVGHYDGTLNGKPVSGSVDYSVSWVYPPACPVETTTTTTDATTTTTRPGETTTTSKSTTTTHQPSPCSFETEPGQCGPLPATGSSTGGIVSGGLGLFAVGLVAIFGARRRTHA